MRSPLKRVEAVKLPKSEPSRKVAIVVIAKVLGVETSIAESALEDAELEGITQREFLEVIQTGGLEG